MVRESFAHKIAMPSNKYFKPSALSTILFIFFLVNQNASAAPGGCSSADFKLARNFEATLSNGFLVASYAVADFNGDGKADLAVGNNGSNADGRVSVLLGDGSGSFSAAPGSPITISGEAGGVAVADFNGDGKRDLAVATYTNGFFVLLGDGS